jgi:hypothetical protein
VSNSLQNCNRHFVLKLNAWLGNGISENFTSQGRAVSKSRLSQKWCIEIVMQNVSCIICHVEYVV